MLVYDKAGGRIRLRVAGGDQFEFRIGAAGPPTLDLACPPRWAAGKQPLDAEFRVYLARAAAQSIVREAELHEVL